MIIKFRFYILYLLLGFALTHCQTVSAASNSATAKELFYKVYNMAFGPEGSSLSYKVNIIGIYKTEGNITYKGKKVQYTEKRYLGWEDGITAYMVDKKTREVEIYNMDDDDKDDYLAMFKYDVNNFNFSYTSEGDYYLVTAKVKKGNFFGIRWVTGKVKKSNLYPVSLTIKVGFFKAKILINNFHPGNIPDSHFIFPKNQFKGYKYIDNRKKK